MKHKLMILLSFILFASCSALTPTEVPRISKKTCKESCETYYKSYLDYDDEKGCFCGKK